MNENELIQIRIKKFTKEIEEIEPVKTEEE